MKQNLSSFPTSLKDEFLIPLSTFMDNFFNETMPGIFNDLGISFTNVAYPKVDIIELKDKIRIVCEIYSLTKEEVKVEVNNIAGTLGKEYYLVISGEKRKLPDPDPSIRYVRRELKHSSFKRSFKINDKLDISKIEAKFETGILNIDIPKKETLVKKEESVNIAIK